MAHSAALARKSGGRDTPLARAAFLVRVGGAQLHRPQWPGCRAGAFGRWLRDQRELLNAPRALPDAGAGAVGAGVAAADDHDALAPRIDERFLIDGIAGKTAILLREKVHREMDAA